MVFINYQYSITTIKMNIFYFVNRWPRNNQSARSDKVMSIIETLLNIGKMVHLVSADPSPQESTVHLTKMPIALVHVNPNKIMASLNAALEKPDLALFNSCYMEQMYSIFLYSKWNKCPRVLQINRLEGLQQWRKTNYQTFNSSFLHQYDSNLYPGNEFSINSKFGQTELKSIHRSDYYFCGNDFISNYLKKQTNCKNYINHSMGVPVTDFLMQVNELQYRDFKHRKHFAFLGNIANQKNTAMINLLINNIWPLIRKEINDVQLHIYGSGYNKQLQGRKRQLEKQGIFIKGFIEDTVEIQKYRAMLYPISNTTGTKGAIVEAWFHHTPVVTTPIGAEGLFLETSEPKFSANQNGQAYTGFFKERIFSKNEQQNEKLVKRYYDTNRLSQDIGKFTFGGLCNSFSFLQFAQNAVKIYTNQQIWKSCLLNSRKSFLRNQSQLQLQINLGFGISQVELAAHQGRRRKEYCQEWDRYLQSKEGYNKLHERKSK